jgi:hypothetical protein
VIDVLECCRRTDLLAISSESALSLLCGIIKYLNAISALRKKKGQKEIQEDRERERHTFDDIDDSILGQQRQQTRTVPRFFHFSLFLFIFFASAFHTPSHPLPSNFLCVCGAYYQNACAHILLMEF